LKETVDYQKSSLKLKGCDVLSPLDVFGMLEKIPELAERADKGSKAAKRFFAARSMLEEASAHLVSKDFSKAFQSFRAAKRTWQLLPISELQWTAFHKSAKRFV